MRRRTVRKRLRIVRVKAFFKGQVGCLKLVLPKKSKKAKRVLDRF